MAYLLSPYMMYEDTYQGLLGEPMEAYADVGQQVPQVMAAPVVQPTQTSAPYAGMTQDQIYQLWQDNPYMEWATGKDYRTPEQLAVSAIFDRLAAGEQIPGWTYNPATTYKSSGDSEQEFSEPATAQYGGQSFLQGGFQQQNDSLGDVFKDVAKLAAIMGTAYLGGTALAGMGGGTAAGTAAGTTAGAVPSAAQAAFLEANMGAMAPVGGMTAAEAAAAATAAETAAPYVMSSADKAALLGNSGYGPGMTGLQTSVYDGLLGATSSKTAASLASEALGPLSQAADWMKANPTAGRLLMSGATSLLSAAGGKSSGGGGYVDSGYRPTISRGGFNPRAQARQMPTQSVGLLNRPTTGQPMSGLWRYGLLG